MGRYEFYVRLARTMSHEWAQRTSGILFLPREHKIHIFELTSNVLLLYKTYWWRRFDDFPKIFQNCSEGQTNVPENFPKISEDFRRLPRTFEGDPKMFRWYTNEFKCNLREKRDITEIIDIFTCEDIISSHVRISYRFYQFVTTRYTTDFYIIRSIYFNVSDL